MANDGTATPDLAVGTRALEILVPLWAFALVVYAVRIWTRIRPKYRLNAADYTVSIAMVGLSPPIPSHNLLAYH